MGDLFASSGRKTTSRFMAPLALDLSVPARVLVIAPHPDDDILGCGGTIFKLARTADVCVVLVTDGSGAGELPTGTDRVRQGEFESALALLGVTDLKYLAQPDGFFESNERLREALIDILIDFAPDWILYPALFDYHRDHVLISEFVFNTACSISRGSTLIEYETSAPLQATHVVDITDVYSSKIAALGRHETALACGDYARAITGLNAYRGLYLGFDKYAEAFRLRTLGAMSVVHFVRGVFWRLRHWFKGVPAK
jgi:LmbE family N-acetylglucosaminyl deacetylase